MNSVRKRVIQKHIYSIKLCQRFALNDIRILSKSLFVMLQHYEIPIYRSKKQKFRIHYSNSLFVKQINLHSVEYTRIIYLQIMLNSLKTEVYSTLVVVKYTYSCAAPKRKAASSV